MKGNLSATAYRGSLDNRVPVPYCGTSLGKILSCFNAPVHKARTIKEIVLPRKSSAYIDKTL